jgi:primary-amine oxidase
MAQTIPTEQTRPQDGGAHPLDPLSAAELEAVVAAVRSSRSLDERHLFTSIRLEEPAKADLAAWESGMQLERAARVTVFDRSRGTLWESVVSVEGEVGEGAELPGAKPPVLLAEAEAAIAAMKADSRVRAGLAKRGITDIENLHVEVWPFGGLVPEHLDDGRRLVWTPIWARDAPDDNAYAHPVRGLHAVIDLGTSEVIEVEDHGVAPVPQESGHFRQSQLPSPRADVRELEIRQPDGASFEVDGWRIAWQKWSLRVGFCPREGLVIHDVRYDDAGVERRIAHRMSIAELVIPYGDPSPGGYRKNAFDTGEVGMGIFTNSLELGCDCLGEIRYLDLHVADNDGSVRTIPNGVCLHEEDDGILWKHTEPDGHVEVRRSRRFVVSSIVTVDNYEYGYFWYFYQDGSIEFSAKLTGIVLTIAADPEAAPLHATEIAPGLLAPYHQHMFCARLDLDIDGERNTVVEVDAVAPPLGPDNPYGGAYVITETPLARESEGQRTVDPFRSRYWKVINEQRLNRLGKPVGYKLVPGHTTFPLALPESSMGKRAAFMYRHLWVTPFAADERYPAGDYPFQHAGGAGLPAWTSADRQTSDVDVVVWYVFGTNHIPRPEDWPVMPVEKTGFQLRPVGFFERNPALDVPASRSAHCGHEASAPA